MPCPPTCYGPTATPAFRAPCPRAVRCTDTADAHAKVCRTFGAGTCSRESADSPQVRTPAHAGGGHRLPRARGSLYGEPQDCSDDWATGQCARLTQHPLPSRFRRLSVEHSACAPGLPGNFDVSQRDTLNRPRLPSHSQPAARLRAAHPHVPYAPRTASSTAFRSGSLRSCRDVDLQAVWLSSAALSASPQAPAAITYQRERTVPLALVSHESEPILLEQPTIVFGFLERCTYDQRQSTQSLGRVP